MARTKARASGTLGGRPQRVGAGVERDAPLRHRVDRGVEAVDLALQPHLIERWRANSLSVARGACVEQYGGGEAFLPILEALGTLCRSRGGERVIETLMHHAPKLRPASPSSRTFAEVRTRNDESSGGPSAPKKG